MENVKPKYDTIAKIPASEFELYHGSTIKEREMIAAPSLTFLQDSWRRLRKNKAAYQQLLYPLNDDL